MLTHRRSQLTANRQSPYPSPPLPCSQVAYEVGWNIMDSPQAVSMSRRSALSRKFFVGGSSVLLLFVASWCQAQDDDDDDLVETLEKTHSGD